MPHYYTDEDFLQILPTESWYTTGMIADLLGCTKQTVNRRLLDLADNNPIEVFDVTKRETVDTVETKLTTRRFAYRLTEDLQLDTEQPPTEKQLP